MKLRTTIAVLLLGLVAWLAIHFLGPTRKPAAAALPLVADEVLAKWDAIELQLSSGSQAKLIREPGAVVIEFGSDERGVHLNHKDMAERPMVARLLEALHDSHRELLTGSRDDLLRAGLDPPRYRVVVHGAGQQVRVDFGEDDSGGNGILAVASDDVRVFRTSRQVADVLDHNLREWRKQAVFDFEPLAVSQIDLVKYDEDPAKPPEVISVARQNEPNTWRFTQPRSMPADAGACLSLAQQASLLRVNEFLAQQFGRAEKEQTGLPDHPRYELTLTAGAAVQHVEIGRAPEQRARGWPCRMELRDPDLCFSIVHESLDPILATTVDSLRPKRLFPRVESTLVALAVARPDPAQPGKTLPVWDVERESLSTRGAWKIRAPFEAKANDGAGDASFAQVVVDVDRIEVQQFLPTGTRFAPEGVLTMLYRTEPVQVKRVFEFARDGKRTLVRDPAQPDDVFAVTPKLGALLDLDLELFRDRELFPKDHAQKLVKRRLVVPSRKAIGVVTNEGSPFPKADGDTPEEWSPRLQGASGELLGAVAAGYVRAKTALAQPGAKEPFASPQFELTLATAEREETLVVGSDDAAAPAGLYCKIRGRLPDDVWVVVPRAAVQKLIELARTLPPS